MNLKGNFLSDSDKTRSTLCHSVRQSRRVRNEWPRVTVEAADVRDKMKQHRFGWCGHVERRVEDVLFRAIPGSEMRLGYRHRNIETSSPGY